MHYTRKIQLSCSNVQDIYYSQVSQFIALYQHCINGLNRPLRLSKGEVTNDQSGILGSFLVRKLVFLKNSLKHVCFKIVSAAECSLPPETLMESNLPPLPIWLDWWQPQSPGVYLRKCSYGESLRQLLGSRLYSCLVLKRYLRSVDFSQHELRM